MLDTVIYILERSVQKHGSVPLTTQHLLNILRMAQEKDEQDAIARERYLDMIEARAAMEDAGDRS